MTRQVSVKEASELFGVSLKTIHRRIESGELKATREGRRYVIDLPDEVNVESLTRRKHDSDVSAVKLAAALAQLEAVVSERDNLRDIVSSLQERLREQNVIIQTMQMTQQKALPAPRKRPWWRFGDREGEEPSGETG